MSTQQPPDPTTKRTRRKSASLSPAHPLAHVPEQIVALPQALLELAPDAIIVADMAGHILYVNHQTEVLFGYARAGLLWGPVEVLLPDDLRLLHEQHRADYVAAPHTRPMGTGLALLGRRQDGTTFPVEVSLSPLQVGDDLLIIGIIRDVTERKRLERERQEQADRLLLQAELIDAAHDAVLVRDPSSYIVAWNAGAQELYGWNAQQALGQVSHTLFQTRFLAGQEAVEAALVRDGRWEGELEHLRADGDAVLVESRQVLVRDRQGVPTAILEINRNITERKRLEVAERVAAEQRQTLLQTVLEELPGGAYLVRGPEATLVLANHAAAAVWGASWLEGQSMATFLQASGICYFAETGQPLPMGELITVQIVRGGPPALQRREIVRRADGTRLPILLSAVALDATLLGEERGGPVAARHEREHAALVLMQDISTVQAAEQLKDEFISIAAHELRTPLTAIQGFASMLSVQTGLGHGPALADWQTEAIAEIEEATARLNGLINDLLDATRIQAGRLELHLLPLDLVALVRRSLTRMQTSTMRHTLTLEVAMEVSDAEDPEMPILLEADSMRLEQVFGNLLGNAVKYSPEGGPITVTVRADARAGVAEVRIQDAGIGIPADQQAQLFQRFVRASNVHDHHIAGSGLGLYVCRELVERHGGHIWFESGAGAGTTFFLTFPLLSAHPLGLTDEDAQGVTHHASQNR